MVFLLFAFSEVRIRSLRLQLILLSLLLASNALLTKSAYSDDAGIDILKQSLDARLSLTTGKCSISGFIQDHVSESRKIVSMDYVFDFRLPAFKIVIKEGGVLLRNQDYSYHTDVFRSCIYRKELSERPSASFPAFDIRTLGLLYQPQVAVSEVNYDFYELRSRYLNGENFQIEKDVDLYRLTFKDTPKGGHFSLNSRIWVDPSNGFNSVRFEVDHPTEGNVLCRSEMNWESVGDVWVIKSLRQENGPSMPVFLLNWELEWSSVNALVPTSEFSENSLIEDGKSAPIYILPIDSDRPIEIGRVSNKPEKLAGVQQTNPKSVSYSKILVYVGVCLASIGVFALFFRPRIKRH